MGRARRMHGRDSVITIVKFVEVRVGIPSFVEMVHVYCVAELLPDAIHVVAESIIGRIRHDHETDLATCLLGERTGLDLSLNRLRRELILGNRSDDAKTIARWDKIDWRRPCHDQRMQN